MTVKPRPDFILPFDAPYNRPASFQIGDTLYLFGGGTFFDDFSNAFIKTSIQNPGWVKGEASNVPARQAGISFSLNGKGYVYGGNNGSSMEDFWEYDPATGKWTVIPKEENWPGPLANSDGVAFSRDNQAYLFDLNWFENYVAIWRFNPDQKWSLVSRDDDPICDVAFCGRSFFPSVISDGNLFTGVGRKGNDPLLDYWSYDLNNETWTKRADFPFTSTLSPASATLDNLVLLIGGDGNDEDGIYAYVTKP